MEDKYWLKDEPICLEIPQPEGMKIVILLLVFATAIGLLTQLVTNWFGDSLWLKGILFSNYSIFGLAALLLTDIVSNHK